ncbi:ATP-dependent DNA helicase [Sporosalibacterium faouarense]|uniref:ATP-dependent DNA helicase n=1 Tax=Sporosalibacterium faouarense TaxID=516123 RepID=UPI00192BBA62|nr:ATP-dependent DNA helicase [Sporosalibacterium faouarense]
MDNIHENLNTKEILNKVIGEKWIAENSKGVFIIKDCILVQNFTGKNYTYRVVNYVTGDQKYLFYRRHELTEQDYEGVINKIKVLSFYDMKRAADGSEMIDVIFKDIFPKYGFVVREEQVELSKHIYENMKDRKISLSDIAVGLGKTHAYLIAAIVHSIFSKKGRFYKQMPIVITTSSIELQCSIIKEYIPEISKMLMENGIISSQITCVLRKGKENYVCENRLKDYFQSLDPKRKRLSEYKGLQKLIQNRNIDLADAEDISGYDKRKINVKSSKCMKCSNFKTCAFQQFMKQARKSTYHFQICNHNYYLADILKRKDCRRSLLPDYQTIIIDEAHKLMDAANQMYGTNINEHEVNHLMKKISPTHSKKKSQKELKNLTSEVMALNQMFFDALTEQIPRKAFSDDTEKFPTTMTLRAMTFLKKMLFTIHEISKKMNYIERQFLIDLKTVMDGLRAFLLETNIYWMENPKAKGQRMLASIPKVISKQLGEDLWKAKRSMILTSGTLAVDGDFSYIKHQLGMNPISHWKINELTKTSPFHFKENCMLYISKKIPYPNADDAAYIHEVGQEISRLIDASNGHALVLFTSYKPLRLIFEHIKEVHPNRQLIAMKRGRNTAIDEFKKSQNAVLFATGSMWEGVNIPGDVLSHLIIVKLPFPIPDPISDYEKSLYPDMNVYLKSVLIPKMLIKLRQGVGRLIRSETDTGVISILDARASDNRRYHQDVLHALPECRRAESIEDIRTFLREKKENSYFE